MNLIFQACVGKTPDFYEHCLQSVNRYAERHQCAHIVQRNAILRIAPLDSKRSENALLGGFLPIYEKEQAFLHLGAYDKVLVLDADVYIRDHAPNIFEQSEADFAGVVEREMPLTPAYFDKIRKYSRGQYDLLTEIDWKWDENGAEFFNMGCMLLNSSIIRHLRGQNPVEFLRRPEFERFVNGEGHWKWSTDQTLLNYWVKQSGMTTTHLDWRWNALYGAIADVSEAYFVHFFLSAKMPRGGAEIPDIIKGL